jgi:hypothetical protein
VKQQSEKLGLDTVEGWSKSPIVASAPTDGSSWLCEDPNHQSNEFAL